MQFFDISHNFSMMIFFALIVKFGFEMPKIFSYNSGRVPLRQIQMLKSRNWYSRNEIICKLSNFSMIYDSESPAIDLQGDTLQNMQPKSIIMQNKTCFRCF